LQRRIEYLDYKPSQIAAACVLLAINVSKSEVATTVGLKQFERFQQEQDELLVHQMMDNICLPLCWWSE